MSSTFTYFAAWVLLWVLLAIVCAFAFLRGGVAERTAAIIIILVAALSALTRFWLQMDASLVPRLIFDGIAALGFLYLAVRFGSLWIGAIMLIQAFQFSLQAYYFVLERPHDLFYVVANNVNFLGILACLGIGTLLAWRNRVAADASEDFAEAI